MSKNIGDKREIDEWMYFGEGGRTITESGVGVASVKHVLFVVFGRSRRLVALALDEAIDGILSYHRVISVYSSL